MPPDTTIEPTTTTTTIVPTTTTTLLVDPPAWTSADVDALTYLVGGGLFLIVALLIAIFVRSGA